MECKEIFISRKGYGRVTTHPTPIPFRLLYNLTGEWLDSSDPSPVTSQPLTEEAATVPDPKQVLIA